MTQARSLFNAHCHYLKREGNKIHIYDKQQHQRDTHEKCQLGVICRYWAKKTNIEYKGSMSVITLISF